jgi:hypothetical protein
MFVVLRARERQIQIQRGTGLTVTSIAGAIGNRVISVMILYSFLPCIGRLYHQSSVVGSDF